jgi:hypothetical protein
MPPKDKPAGSSRKKPKPMPATDGPPLDSVDKPPVLKKAVRLNSEGLKYTSYEELAKVGLNTYISEILCNNTVEVTWRSTSDVLHELIVHNSCLSYPLVVPGLNIYDEQTMAEIDRRQAEKQQGKVAKTKSDQDKQLVLEKARLDAQKAAARLEAQKLEGIATTEKTQVAMAQVLLKREEYGK